MKDCMENTIDKSSKLEKNTDNDDAYETGNENQILELISNDQLEELADIIVDKMLNSRSLKNILSKKQDSRFKNRDEERLKDWDWSEEKAACEFYIRDLLGSEIKPLELGSKAKFAEDYLNVIRLVYSELHAELGNIFFYENKESLRLDEFAEQIITNDDILDLLYRIEVFVVVLAYNSTPAYLFDTESIEDLERESFAKVKSRITALGFELLYFFNNLKKLRKLKDGKYLSENIKLFLNFIDDYKYNKIRYNRIENDLLGDFIYFRSLNELNYFLVNLKRAMVDGSFQLKTLSALKRYLFSKPINDILSGQSIADFQSAITKYSNKINSVKKYFRTYKSSSITLYRMRIWLDVDSERGIDLRDFKTFFSELNKKASKPEVGFRGYLNFFYIWDMEGHKWFQDIVIIMDSETLLNLGESGSTESIRYITQEFEAYVNEFLKYRANEIFGEHKVPRLRIKSTPLLFHLDLKSQFLMEANDREAWKIFENSILPFFVYHEMLELNLEEEVRERFSRGRKKIVQ